MKGVCIFVAGLLAVSSISCNKANVVSPNSSTNDSTIKIGLSMKDAPSDVARVVGVLSRQGYDTLTSDFAILNDSARCQFDDVPSGTWNLEVNAYDSMDSLRYTGSTSVQVIGGQITAVNLVLNPATGSISVTVTWGTGMAGNALSLDGQSGYMQVPNSPSLSSADTAITMEAWVRPEDQYYNTVVAKGSYNYLLEFAGGLYPGIILHGTTLSQTSANYWGRLMMNQAVPADQWTHIAVTYSASTGLKVYYGAQLVCEAGGTGEILPTSLPLRIGARVDSLYTEYFKGEIDGVRIWNVVRPQYEIAQNMNRELTGDQPGLVAYYKFDEPAGSTVIHDSSPYHNDGNLYGNAILVRSTAF